jgi:pimeloyl-ACP methyl ester carboxylesterase
MSKRPRRAGHAPEVVQVHARLLASSGLTSSVVHTSDSAAVHVMRRGSAGPPVVLIHGTGSPGAFFLPLVAQLAKLNLYVVDRPGFGLSDPVPATGDPQQGAVGWVGRLLDALELPAAILVGHSMGALWSLRFALAYPERVTGLAMMGTPTLPGTRAPLPFRMMGTPGIRSVLARQRETPKSFRAFAKMVGEADTVAGHPDLVDLMVAVGNDPIARQALHDEISAVISPWALVSRTGFRRTVMVTEAELGGLAIPSLLVWGVGDPLAGSDVAERLHELMPDCELCVVQGGHAPWLGQAEAIAATLQAWVNRVQRAIG